MDWEIQFGILVQIMRTVAIFVQKRLHKLPLAVIITFCKRLSIRFTEGERKLTHSKKEMRKAYLARLQQLDQNTRLREQHRLAQKLYDLPQWTNAKTVALTMSQSFELDTAPLILHARHEGKRVLVPRTLPKRQMEFVQIDEDTEFEETGFEEHPAFSNPANGEFENSRWRSKYSAGEQKSSQKCGIKLSILL